MKKIVISGALGMLLAGSAVLANMMDGRSYGSMYGTGLALLIYFAIAAFIFSIIFWLTHNWLVKEKKRK